MAQNSVDFLWRWWNDNPFASYEQGLEAYRQAKEKEKEQIKEAYEAGKETYRQHLSYGEGLNHFDFYYNKTYKK